MNDTLAKMLTENNASLEAFRKPHCVLNNRKLDRFPVQKGIYALLFWNGLKNHVLLGHMIDISKEGCGIYYIHDRSSTGSVQSQKTCKLRIIGPYQMVELKKAVITYDNEVTQYSTAQICAMRCGIKFDFGKDS